MLRVLCICNAYWFFKIPNSCILCTHLNQAHLESYLWHNTFWQWWVGKTVLFQSKMMMSLRLWARGTGSSRTVGQHLGLFLKIGISQLVYQWLRSIYNTNYWLKKSPANLAFLVFFSFQELIYKSKVPQPTWCLGWGWGQASRRDRGRAMAQHRKPDLSFMICYSHLISISREKSSDKV